jgi:hypothetical protein
MRKLILIAALALATTAARADNGFWYVGAGVVRNSLTVTVSPDDIPAPSDGSEGGEPIDLNNTAWKAYVGVRPLRWLAGELDYIDLGSGGVADYAEANGKAVAAYAVGFLPIPLPLVDVFGKVGLARWRLNATVFSLSPYVPASETSSDGTGFAWGIGAQAQISMVGVRLEYEGFTVTHSNGAHIASLSVFFSF